MEVHFSRQRQKFVDGMTAALDFEREKTGRLVPVVFPHPPQFTIARRGERRLPVAADFLTPAALPRLIHFFGWRLDHRHGHAVTVALRVLDRIRARIGAEPVRSHRSAR